MHADHVYAVVTDCYTVSFTVNVDSCSDSVYQILFLLILGLTIRGVLVLGSWMNNCLYSLPANVSALGECVKGEFVCV